MYNIARGIDLEPVTTRLVSKSIGCCKKFPGRTALITSESVQHWLNELAAEIADRLEQDMSENNRRAKQIVVSYAQEIDTKDVSGSKTTFLNSYNQKRIFEDAFAVLRKQCMKSDGSFCLKFLGLSAGNFDSCKNVCEITSFFKNNCKSVPGVSTQQFPTVEQTDTEENRLCDTSKYFENKCNIEKIDGTQSLYDQSTDEQSSINSEELVFYDDKFMVKTECNKSKEEPENDRSNDSLSPILTTLRAMKQHSLDCSSSDEDSISNEILLSNKNVNSEIEKDEKGGSYFIKHFDNIKINNEKQVKRDFNTSKVLENDSSASEDDSASELVKEEHETTEYTNSESNSLKSNGIFDSIFNNPSTSRVIDDKVPCSECGKKIIETEMVSHMDYHLALEIVRSEADLYKPNKSVNESKTTKISGKRKATQIEGQCTLESFVKKDNTIDMEESETCPECNKRVCKSELESHRDYHVAKKLHMEINSSISTSLQNIPTNKSTNKSKMNTKQKHAKVKPVTAFFKHS